MNAMIKFPPGAGNIPLLTSPPPLIHIVWRRIRAESLISPIKRRLLIDRDSPLSATCDPFFFFFSVGTGGNTAVVALVW